MKVPTKKKQPLEKKIQNDILKWLTEQGYFVWQNKSVGLYDPYKGRYRKKAKYEVLGISDILGVLPNGRFLAIEVKRPGGVISEYQQQFIKNVGRNGGVAFVAFSLQDVKDRL